MLAGLLAKKKINKLLILPFNKLNVVEFMQTKGNVWKKCKRKREQLPVERKSGNYILTSPYKGDLF